MAVVRGIRRVFDGLVLVLGGIVFFTMIIIGLFCVIAALLGFAAENRLVFRRLSRTVGVLIAILGILLPFRKVSFIGTILCFEWTAVLFHAFPKFEFIQGIGALLVNIAFWIIQSRKIKSSWQIFGDVVVFLILPGTLTLVYLSRGFDLLGERPNSGGPVIPLQKWLSKLGSFISRIIPASQ
jgi:hypothetical protein